MSAGAPARHAEAAAAAAAAPERLGGLQPAQTQPTPLKLSVDRMHGGCVTPSALAPAPCQPGTHVATARGCCKPDQVSTANFLQRSRQLRGLRNSPQSTKAARPFAPASLGSLYSAATSMQVQAVTTKPHSAACRGPCRRRRSAVTAIAAPERPVVPPPEKRIPPPEVHSSESERCVCSFLGAWGCIHGLFDA